MIWSMGQVKLLFRRAFFIFLGLLTVFVIVVLFQSVCPEQELGTVSAYDFPPSLVDFQTDVDSLEKVFGVNKVFADPYKKAALFAMTVFPELANESITFVMTTSGAPLETNFEWLTLFLPRSQRIYEIRLNDASESKFDGILMRDLSLDAQVAILAHELGHVRYYQSLSSVAIAKWGLLYLIDYDFRAIHERSTDQLVIKKGLGNQLYKYARFVRYSEKNKKLYQVWGDYMDRFYLTDQEVLEYMMDIH